MNIETILDQAIQWTNSNTVGIITFIGVMVAFYLFKGIGIARLTQLSKKTDTDFDDFLIDLLKTIRFSFGSVLALTIAVLVSGANPFSGVFIPLLIIFAITHQINRSVTATFAYFVRKISGNDRNSSSLQGLKTILHILIWTMGALTMATILGYEISSIIAGLGIGGIAIALAVQNVLGDVLSSFAIYFDKPFTVGDYITTGDVSGTVEQIGLKSTRVRSLQGEEVILSNKAITESTIQNFGRLARRREILTLGFVYETSNKMLEQIPEGLRAIIDRKDNVTFERCYFKEFGDSALIYETTYYVDSSEFGVFASTKHDIHLEIKAWLEKKKIDIAYPTQQIIVRK